MRPRLLGGVAVLLTALLMLPACGGGNSTSSALRPSTSQGAVYVTGSDAPLASVVGFQVTLTSLKLSDGTNTVEALSDPITLDFARLLGLRTLLGLNQVNTGTYTSATLAIQDPVISYLDTTSNPPAIKTLNGYFGSQGTTTTTVQLGLNPNLVVGENGLGGLHVHLNLHDSIETNSNGDFTGNILPQIQIRALKQTDEDCHVDELLGGIVSVDAANNQFVMQRWHGRNITVKVNSQTQWSGEGSNTWTLASLQPGYTVEISGAVEPDRSILADSIEVVSIDKFYLGGLVLQVVPPTGAANNFTLFVRTEMPDVPNVSVPGTAMLNINDQTRFDIRRFNLPVEAFLFNPSMMVTGQRVGVAGIINSDNSLTLKRVALKRQGLEGKPVADSVQIGATRKEGSFLLQNNGMFGSIMGGVAIKVMTSQLPNALQDVQSMTSGRLVMWGLLLKDSSGQPVYVAGYVNKVN
jgi:Domain of unknown function (DUF5666)